jgi:hypothetical protein
MAKNSTASKVEEKQSGAELKNKLAPAKTKASAVKSPSSAASQKNGAKAVTDPVVKKQSKLQTTDESSAAPKDKNKKAKLVRDSFTMPDTEYKALADVKRDCLKSGFEVKKSELLRVGVALVRQMEIDKLKSVLSTLPSLKTGRPKKGK